MQHTTASPCATARPDPPHQHWQHNLGGTSRRRTRAQRRSFSAQAAAAPGPKPHMRFRGGACPRHKNHSAGSGTDSGQSASECSVCDRRSMRARSCMNPLLPRAHAAILCPPPGPAATSDCAHWAEQGGPALLLPPPAGCVQGAAPGQPLSQCRTCLSSRVADSEGLSPKASLVSYSRHSTHIWVSTQCVCIRKAASQGAAYERSTGIAKPADQARCVNE